MHTEFEKQLADSVQQMANDIDILCSDVKEGNCDCLQSFRLLRILANGLDKAMKELTPYAVAEGDKYSKAEQAEMGFTISSRTTYKYENIEEIAELQKRIKELQKAAQANGTAEKNISTFITFK